MMAEPELSRSEEIKLTVVAVIVVGALLGLVAGILALAFGAI